jgi:hypothetical protein
MSVVWFRLVLGFLVAPVFPGLLIALLAVIFGFGKSDEGIWVIKLSGMLGYPIAIVLGLPLYFFLSSRGWNGLPVTTPTWSVLSRTPYRMMVAGAQLASGDFANSDDPGG